jgi:acetyl-CoA carboxylase carboxyl transferase subunit alpha
MNHLDFEKPIYDLEQKIVQLKALSIADNDILAKEISNLETRVEELRSKVFANLTRWQRVQLARHPERPYTLDYIDLMCGDFIELHGDRYYADDKALVGGIATIDGQSVMIMGHQKGRDTKTRQYRNFGMANPEGYRKALRLMKLAEKYNIPVITLLDTPGAFPGLEAEERGQAEAIARNLMEMAVLRVPNHYGRDWRRSQRRRPRNWNGQRSLHVGEHLVFGHIARVVLQHSLENLGV